MRLGPFPHAAERAAQRRSQVGHPRIHTRTDIELVPPAVQTDLMPGSATNPHDMPLSDSITEAVAKLTAQPTPDEVLVDRVLLLRHAEPGGRFNETFAMLNQLGQDGWHLNV
jgi:short-subunit dehydrogenase involved in D-alanine esterification of teichoic acids